jgi:hypothetical protein
VIGDAPAPVPDVYGDQPLYVCRCRTAHGVRHICALCRETSDWKPTEPYVPAERCRACLVDEAERLEVALNVVTAKLRRAEHAIDPITEERIPPRFLTPKGWME